MSQDQKYMTILSVCHFVVAALIAVISCFPIIHLAAGVGMINDFRSIPSDPGVPATVNLMFRLMPFIFIAVASVAILGGWAFAIAVAFSGLFLHRRHRHTYCLVIAGLECTFTPFGTVLGIFTILMLSKPEIRNLFHSGGTVADVTAVVS